MTQEKKQPTFSIVQSSPQALQAEAKKQHASKLYPFDDLEVGKSFTCQINEVNWKSLRICVYKQNAREEKNETGKEFKFIKHDDLGVVEVARIS